MAVSGRAYGERGNKAVLAHWLGRGSRVHAAAIECTLRHGRKQCWAASTRACVGGVRHGRKQYLDLQCLCLRSNVLPQKSQNNLLNANAAKDRILQN